MFACRSIIVVLSFGLAASAADPPKSDPDKLARDLGSAVFAERDKASRELWKLGEAARSALEKAARSDDPEVAKRAEDILEKFNWGIFPDTPAGVLKQIKEFRSNELERQTAAISALLRAEPRGVDTLALVLSHELEAERRGELYRHLLVESRDAVPLAMFREKSDRAEAILRIGATGPDPEAWLDYALFMQRRDRLPAATTHLDTIARRPGPLQVSAAASLAVASHLAGRSTDALKRLRALPKDSLAPHLLPSMLEDARAWTELAEESDADEGPPNLGLSLFRHRKSGNRPKTDELLDAARKAGAEGDRERAAETGLALFLNEKPLDGIAVLKQRQAHPRLLADVYAGRLMFKEVLELLGDGPIAKELDDEDDARDRVYYEMRKARVFAQIGRKDDAVQLFNRIHAASRERDHYIVRELMRAELRAGCFDLAAEHAGVAIDALDRIGNRFAAAPEPFELLFDEDAEAARGLWRAFRKLPATAAEAPGATMRRVRALLLGKPNEKQVQDARAALAAPPTGEDSQADRVRHARAAAALARRAERWDEVEKHLRTAVQLWSFDRDGNLRTPEDIRQQTAASFEGPRAWMFSTNETVKIAIDLGEFLVERGRPAEAAKVFEQAWRQYPGNPIPLYLSGRALLAAHDETEGKRRIALAHAVALGDAQYRGRFLHELCERGQMADLRIARDDAARCAWFWTPYRGNVWNAMARASFLLKEFEPSAVAIERNLHFLLKTPNVVFVDGIGYISVPTNVRANRARALLAEGKTDAAFAESKAILQLLPGQTEFLTAIVPEFERVGKKAEADALFAITWTKLETLRRENPESAWLPATMAFAAAGCRREPDAALAYAKKAVDREPNIRWHREVLAEVLFRRGERAAAVAIGEELRKIDHRSHYFRRLLDRYKTGDVASPLPLSPEED